MHRNIQLSRDMTVTYKTRLFLNTTVRNPDGIQEYVCWSRNLWTVGCRNCELWSELPGLVWTSSSSSWSFFLIWFISLPPLFLFFFSLLALACIYFCICLLSWFALMFRLLMDLSFISYSNTENADCGFSVVVNFYTHFWVHQSHFHPRLFYTLFNLTPLTKLHNFLICAL